MNLIITSAEDLRRIIREELSKSGPFKPSRPVEAPITTAQLCDFLNVTEPTIVQLGLSTCYDKVAVLTLLESCKKGVEK